MKTTYIITIREKKAKKDTTFVFKGTFNQALKYAKYNMLKGEYIKSITEA